MKKSTIDAEGNASDEQVVVDGGLLQFPFMSPDGNFVGHASGASNIMAKYVAGPMKGKDIKVGMKKGCHTHVTADSKWVIAATGQVGKSDGSWAGKSGLGSYHFGSSQDMKWAVTRSQPGAQNHGLECKLFSLNTEGGNWKVTAVGAFSDDASWVDVHTYEKTSNKILQKTPQRMAATLSGKGIQFKVDKPGQYRIEIFNSLGKQVGFLQLRYLTQGKNFVAWSRILNNEIKSSMSRVHIVRIKADKGEFVQRWVF
jgi:hypothetical protein